jgi:hypothetical protein
MRMLLFCLLSLTTLPAFACECANGMLDTQAVRESKNVFVFKVMAAAVVPSEAHPHRAVAKIKIIDRLRGTARFDTVSYSTSWCCGLRIEVGGEYMLFTTAVGPKLEIDRGNLLALGPFAHLRQSKLHRDVLAILAGTRDLGES